MAGAVAYSNAFFGRGSGSILLDRLQCIGSERRLLNCTHRSGSLVSIFCGHNDDAGVQCACEYVVCRLFKEIDA